MTEQDESRAIGDLVLAKKKAAEHYALLEAEARRIGQYLSTLGGQLQSNSANVVFDQQSFDGRFQPTNTMSRRDFPTLDALLDLTDDARRTLIELAKAEEGLKKYGV